LFSCNSIDISKEQFGIKDSQFIDESKVIEEGLKLLSYCPNYLDISALKTTLPFLEQLSVNNSVFMLSICAYEDNFEAVMQLLMQKFKKLIDLIVYLTDPHLDDYYCGRKFVRAPNSLENIKILDAGNSQNYAHYEIEVIGQTPN